MSDNQQFCLRWNNHQSTLVQVIDSLLSSGVLVDCTLAAEGQFLHAHKVVLCACSPYLETLLSQHYEKHPIVILKDVKFQELKSMMDYMYKGEVNISQDQLGQFLKAAESLQIKGLTDGGGESDSRDVGSTSQKRHEPTPVRKPVPHNQSRSPLVLPPHNSGLTIEPSKRSLPPHLSESQPDSPIRSREGSTSPTPRKRRRPRRPSQGDDDHQDNSCDLPMQAQSMSITTVPTSIPPLPGSSSTITKAPPPDDDSENQESDRLSGVPAEGFIKEKIEPQPEMLIEPKTEYMDETNNDDSVEDLTLDDDDDYENMLESGPGPSHGGSNPNENYATWQQITGDRQEDAYLNPTDTGHRDSQGGPSKVNVEDEPELGVEIVSCKQPKLLRGRCKKPVCEMHLRHESKRDKKSVVCKAVGCCSDTNDQSDHIKNYSKKRFTPFQVQTLKRVFEESPYITQSQAASIARQTGLKKLQVRKWFSDYRCKIKKQSICFERHGVTGIFDDDLCDVDECLSNEAGSSPQHFELDPSVENDESEAEIEEEEENVAVRVQKSSNAVCSKRSRRRLKKRDVEYASVTTKRTKKTNSNFERPESNRTKRFSPYQVEMLKKAYQESPYITQRQAAVIARSIGLKKMQVRKWFCDYRCKIKKQSLRMQRDGSGDNVDVYSKKFVHVPKKSMSMRLTNNDQANTKDPEHDLIDDDSDELYNGVVDDKRRRIKMRFPKRTFRFSASQLKVLNDEFDQSQFLTEEKLSFLCTKLQEKRERIQTWFKMRRYKLRQSEQKFWQNIIDNSV